MDFAFTYSPYYLLLIVPITAALTWWMYRSTGEMLSRGFRWALHAFRFTVLTLLAILLLDPLITSLTKLSFPPIIAVIQDNSESLVIQSDSAYVRQELPGALKEFTQGFDSENYQVDLYSFDTGLNALESADSLTFDRTGTNLSAALREVSSLYQNQNLGAVVLLSDGIPTAGTNPLYRIEGQQQPVYTVLLGDTTPQRDIRIEDVLYNEIAYLDAEMPIRVNVRGLGYEQANLQVSLRTRNKTLGTQALRLNRGQMEGAVDFVFKPGETGLQQVTATVSRLDGEITYRNNVRTFYVNVLETRVKIALLAGSPHPDVGTLHNAFEREESYELTEFVLKEPGVYYNSPEATNLEDFDLFILHNWPQSPRDAEMVGRIETLIKDKRVPILYVAGQTAHLQTLAPLYPYMAITPNRITTKSEEVIADFASSYRNHSTYTFSDTWLNWLNRAPPLFRNQSDWQAKATAQVFATAKIKNVSLDYPVFAIQNQLGRKNIVLLGENFWRWRAHSYLEAEDFELFDAWLFNLVKWLMVNDDKRKFIVAPSKKFFTAKDVVSFKGQAYDDSYNPIPGVDMQLTLTGPDGKAEEYFLNETREGQYFLELYNLGEGTYSYAAQGSKNGRRIGRDRGEFSIGRSNVEHFQLQADQDLMQQLALRTGGLSVPARELSSLVEPIKALPGLKPKIDYKRNRQPFQRYGWIMLLLLLLLSTEWVVRKLNSML